MGTWGTGVSQSDEFAEIYEDFFEAYTGDADPTACTGRVRRDGEPVPYGGKRSVPVIASLCAHWRGPGSASPHPPSPFSMFSNGNLKTPTFSFFNFQFSIRPGAGNADG